MKMQAKCILNTGETCNIDVDLDYLSTADDVYAQCNNAIAEKDKFVHKIENLEEIVDATLQPYKELVGAEPETPGPVKPEPTDDYHDHPQTTVFPVDPKTGEIREIHCDRDIAPIINRLNEVGAYTAFSCQNLNNLGIAQFGFKYDNVSADKLMHALDIIAAAFPGRIIYLDINRYFDPIICAAENLQALDNYGVCTRWFHPSKRVVEERDVIPMRRK